MTNLQLPRPTLTSILCRKERNMYDRKQRPLSAPTSINGTTRRTRSKRKLQRGRICHRAKTDIVLGQLTSPPPQAAVCPFNYCNGEERDNISTAAVGIVDFLGMYVPQGDKTDITSPSLSTGDNWEKSDDFQPISNTASCRHSPGPHEASTCSTRPWLVRLIWESRWEGNIPRQTAPAGKAVAWLAAS